MNNLVMSRQLHYTFCLNFVSWNQFILLYNVDMKEAFKFITIMNLWCVCVLWLTCLVVEMLIFFLLMTLICLFNFLISFLYLMNKNSCRFSQFMQKWKVIIFFLRPFAVLPLDIGLVFVSVASTYMKNSNFA